MSLGRLYIVATPIGNLEDISERVIKTLQQVDIIYAEDTRHSKKLLHYFSIDTSMKPLHEHNEKQQIDQILQWLQQGKHLAIISDAGTPLISDPGFPIVNAVQQAGLTVSPVPGACAAIAALSASGLSSDKFMFEGFLPAKKEARIKTLTRHDISEYTRIFYEAPHRIVDTLKDMISVFGEMRLICFARELTKQYETIRLASLKTILTWVENDPNQQKGEIVLILDKAEVVHASYEEAKSLLKILLNELPASQACKIAAKLTGMKKKQLYDICIALQGK